MQHEVTTRRAVKVRRRWARQAARADRRRQRAQLLAAGLGLSLHALAASTAFAQTDTGGGYDGYGGGGGGGGTPTPPAAVTTADGWTLAATDGGVLSQSDFVGPRRWQTPVLPNSGDVRTNYLGRGTGMGWYFGIAPEDTSRSERPFNLLPQRNRGREADDAADTLTFEYAPFDPIFTGEQPRFVESYALRSAGPTSSTIDISLGVENIGPNPLSMNVFFYNDFDVNEPDFNRDVAFPSGDAIVQNGQQFGSQIAFERLGAGAGIRPLAGVAGDAIDLLELMESDFAATTAADVNAEAASGPGDLGQLYMWSVNLASGISSTIDMRATLTREEIVFPDRVIDPEDPDAPEGDGYGSTFEFPDAEPKRRTEPRQTQPRTYDPEFALGYDYTIGDADNGFAELYLAHAIGDSTFTLEVTDPDSPLFGQIFTLTTEDTGGDGLSFVLDFVELDPENFVKSFRLTGIEMAAMIDPDDPLGFPDRADVRQREPDHAPPDVAGPRAGGARAAGAGRARAGPAA